MRLYYIFSIKQEFFSLYKDQPELLFQVLKQIYYMHEGDIAYAFNLFTQLTEKINKVSLDRRLFIELHKKMPYSKSGNQHIMNDLYKDEVSILVVKASHILISSNHNFSSFFKYLLEKDHNYFVCDFNYNDYFWLKQVKLLERI